MGETLISVLIVIDCILLILVVLVQNSKGGGLASSFSSSNQVMGVRKTADFLEKATWALAGTLLFLSVISTSFIRPSATSAESETRQKANEAPPTEIPINNGINNNGMQALPPPSQNQAPQ